MLAIKEKKVLEKKDKYLEKNDKIHDKFNEVPKTPTKGADSDFPDSSFDEQAFAAQELLNSHLIHSSIPYQFSQVENSPQNPLKSTLANQELVKEVVVVHRDVETMDCNGNERLLDPFNENNDGLLDPLEIEMSHPVEELQVDALNSNSSDDGMKSFKRPVPFNSKSVKKSTDVPADDEQTLIDLKSNDERTCSKTNKEQSNLDAATDSTLSKSQKSKRKRDQITGEVSLKELTNNDRYVIPPIQNLFSTKNPFSPPNPFVAPIRPLKLVQKNPFSPSPLEIAGTYLNLHVIIKKPSGMHPIHELFPHPCVLIETRIEGVFRVTLDGTIYNLTFSGPIKISSTLTTSQFKIAHDDGHPFGSLEVHDEIPILRTQELANATLLLHAGGIVTEQNRTTILALEKKVISGFAGLWIPVERARFLCLSMNLKLPDAFMTGDLQCEMPIRGITTSQSPPTPRKTGGMTLFQAGRIEPVRVTGHERTGDIEICAGDGTDDFR